MAATITALNLVVAASILAIVLAAGAQPAGEVRRIGYLSSSSATAAQNPVEVFRKALRGLGWVEGQNIVIDYRFAEGRFERLPDLAGELVRLKVDVIVAGPTPVAVAAKNATSAIPIIMWAVGDPVGLGLVASLARPDGNITGVSFTVDMEVGKALELLMEVVPTVRRVAVLSNPNNPGHARAMTNVRTAARSRGLQLQLLEARGPDEFDGAMRAVAKERAGALLVVTDSVFLLHRARLVELAAKSRLPSVYQLREYVEAGGLMSYGPSGPDLFRRAAGFVDRVLKGAKPADLPVEQPTKFDFFINLRTAKALRVTIPPSLLVQADQVLE